LATSCAAHLVVPITIYNQSQLSDGDIDAIVETANRLWQPYGVTLIPVSVHGVAVIVADKPPREAQPHPRVLGTTMFTDGHANPYIHLWVGAAYALLDTGSGWPLTTLTQIQHESSLRPMLGVALAHEFGHFLLDTPHHAVGGLLQALVSVSDLRHPTTEHLGLTADQQHTLCLAHDTIVARQALRDNFARALPK
jgi:hypothetical protein